MVVERVGIGRVIEDARDGVKSIRGDCGTGRWGAISVHHCEKSGGARRGRETTDERGETCTWSKTGAGGEASARSESSAECGWIKA